MKSQQPISDQEQLKALGDATITAVLMQLERSGMPPEMLLDRLGTCFAAHYAKAFGKANTVAMLKHMTKRVAAGAFDTLTGEGSRH